MLRKEFHANKLSPSTDALIASTGSALQQNDLKSSDRFL
jgi:hypothetical protein